MPNISSCATLFEAYSPVKQICAKQSRKKKAMANGVLMIKPK
jgi:hypothetical protein